MRGTSGASEIYTFPQISDTFVKLWAGEQLCSDVDAHFRLRIIDMRVLKKQRKCFGFVEGWRLVSVMCLFPAGSNNP